MPGVAIEIGSIVEVADRLMTVYIVDGVSYPTKNSARKALTAKYKRDAGEDMPHRFCPELPEPEQEYRSAYQVVVEGEVIEELPTLHMAQQKVRNVSNKQSRHVNTTLICFKQSRDTVYKELPELAELIAMYSFEDMDGVLNEYGELERALLLSHPNTFEYFLNQKVGGVRDAISWGFVLGLYEKVMMLRKGLSADAAGDADTAFVPPIEIARQMIDRDRVVERGMERLRKVAAARDEAQLAKK